MTARAYGYIPDVKDDRDYEYAAPRITANLPAVLDLTTNANYPAAYDQGVWGSCVGNAAAFCMAHAIHVPRPADPFVMLSRMEIYYLARALRGLENQDGGCMGRDAIKVAAKGVAEEALWTYTRDHLFTPPPPEVLAAGVAHTAIQYSRISSPTVDNIRSALFSGHPVMLGTLVYPSFESDEAARTGLVPMPQPGERPISGHELVAVGSHHPKRLFKMRGSWGQYGDNGHMWMPYDYIANLKYTADLWVIQRAGQAV